MKGTSMLGQGTECAKCIFSRKIKLSKGVPDLHSFRGDLSSVLPLAGEDVSFNYYLVEGPSQDHLTQGPPEQFRY